MMVIWRLIAYSEVEERDGYVQWSRKNGEIAVGWWGVGDLREQTFRNAENLARIVAKGHPTSTASNATNGGQSFWRFYSEMMVGDLVVLNARKPALAMRVTSDYYFVNGSYPPYYPHRRKAEVLPIDPETLWRLSGGKAEGQSVYGTLIRCANEISDAQFKSLVG